jgi:myosin heavy subunit
MFNFIVQSINKKIDYKMEKGMRGVSKAAFIGVLDIFGFESFDVNSFEQMCINYCNEALQQQFNLYIFKNEQEEYKREGISWENIEFPDNKEVIELIDKRAEGIIPLLTDQCKTSRGSDKSFAESLYKRCEKHPRFHASALIQGKKQFIIHHYAGPVVYHYEGFVEKNKDEIPRGASTLLEGSSIAFVQLLGQIGSSPPSSSTGRAAKRPTAGGQFTRQLTELRKRIDLTSPHYIRCLKPNQSLMPNEFDKAMIADQLRYAGVLEAIRVSRVGYSQRYAHDTFVARYKFIAVEELEKASDKLETLIKATAKKIFLSENPNAALPADVNNAVGIQKGTTKVFLRQPAFEYLEAFRVEKLSGSAVTIQALARMYVARCHFLETKGRIILAQACTRRHMAQRFIIKLRNDKSATAIQGQYRMWRSRKQYLQKKWLAMWFQKMTRGNAGRKRYQEVYDERQKEIELNNRKNMAAVGLQALYRGNVGRNDVAELKKRNKQKDSFYEEQSEAITLLKEQNKKAALQADKAAAIAVQTRKETKKEVEALQKELEGASAAADKAKSTQEEIMGYQSELETLRKELEISRAETERARTRLVAVESENKTLKTKLEGGSFMDGHTSTRFEDHADLMSLDSRIHNIALRSKQGKKDLEALVQSLAILK